MRNLDVVFDKYFAWDAHVSALVKKCNGILIGLSHVRHQIPSHLLPTLVPWSSRTSDIIWPSLVTDQRKTCNASKGINFALRVVSGRSKFDHISDVRDELDWPTARQMYELHSLNFLHKIRCTQEPEALSSQSLANSSLRSRSTRQDCDLALSRARTEAGRRRLLFSTAQIYI